MAHDIILAQTFFDAQKRLGHTQLKAVQSAVTRLQEGGAQQVRLHALSGNDYESFDVTRGALRVICYRDGNTLALLYVDTHQEAYDWANKHRLVRIGQHVRLKRVRIEDDEPQGVEPGDSTPVMGPLAPLRARELAKFGLDEEVADYLRLVPNNDVLLGLAEHLRSPLGEALLSLGVEPERLGEVLRDFESGGAEESSDLGEALRRPANAEHFWAPRPGEEDLARALSGDFEAWQIFLHPAQRRVARMRASGPVKLTGGPGTGKTVVALHRARFLAEEVFADDPRPVLLTGFSRSLVAELERSFGELVRDRPELAARVRCRTATRVALDVLESAEQPRALLSGEALDEAWSQALAGEKLGLGRAFYEAEREEVVMALAAFTEQRYLRVPRRGRGRRLGLRERKQVFEVLGRLEQALDARGGADDAGLARRALVALPEASPYAAVVLDELQDAHPSSLRLLHALSGDGPDRLFLAGDGYQRIFRRPVPLSRMDIPVVGRSRHLRLNYRTTSGIRAAAVELMLGHGSDPLDDDEAGNIDRSPRAGRSVRPGPRPEVIEVRGRDEALERMAALLGPKARASGRALVLVPSRAELEAVSAGLDAKAVLHQRLHAADVPFAPSGPQVGLCTFHRAKGLEAAHVVVWDGPRSRRPPGMEDETWARHNRSLRYVAITRARDRCTVLRTREARDAAML